MNVLAIGCHPDDVEIACSGTLAKCVKRGDKVGELGSSGRVTGPHLHYEVRRDSVRLDPLHFMFASVSPEDYIGMLFMSSNTGQSMD